jgi:H+/Cl- antiporter ClcA
MNLGLFLLLPLLLGGVILRFRSALISLLVTATLGIGHFLLCLHAYYTWNLWLYAVYPILGLLACFSGMYVYQYVKEQKKRQQMRYAFGKYVSPASQ